MRKVNLNSKFCTHAKVNAGEVQTDWFDEEVSGLALRVSATRKAWTLHFTSPANGKRGRMKLGTFPAMSLAQARTRAREAKAAVEAGTDPRGTTGGTMTISDLVESFLTNHVKINLRTAPEVERRLRKNILPVIGSLPLADLHRRDVNRIVEPILRRDAPLEATRAFEDLRSMVRWAVANR